ncbi:unnamed protein product [Nesidiocoris tenuis]|uniref:Uncharacterized protein n=1 Tax=Nesidiocoris tenuis TaxID=355587 RepID=A0A6H5GT68_9HEMI|nr:unnamed protein product [Nesidiocoris tenuis]
MDCRLFHPFIPMPPKGKIEPVPRNRFQSADCTTLSENKKISTWFARGSENGGEIFKESNKLKKFTVLRLVPLNFSRVAVERKISHHIIPTERIAQAGRAHRQPRRHDRIPKSHRSGTRELNDVTKILIADIFIVPGMLPLLRKFFIRLSRIVETLTYPTCLDLAECAQSIDHPALRASANTVVTVSYSANPYYVLFIAGCC